MSQYLCPECGSDSQVLETRPSYSRLRRRRLCQQNSHKFSTIEVPLTAPQQIDDLFRFAIDNHHDQGEDMIAYVQAQLREILHGLQEDI